MTWRNLGAGNFYRRTAVFVLCTSLALLVSACQSERKDQKAASEAAAETPEKSADPAHHHIAPHGGLLVELGDHFANLEVVFDRDTGRLTAYILDGCAEHAIRIEQETLPLAIVMPGTEENPAGHAFVVILKAVANPLTGETVGDTSEFSAVVPKLLESEGFAAMSGGIEIRGTLVPGAHFLYPEGFEMDVPSPKE